MRWLISLATALFVILAIHLDSATTAAEDPTPAPTPGSHCPEEGLPGGGVHVLPPSEVTLPEGVYTISIAPPGADQPVFGLCHHETGAVLEFNASNCTETRRETPSEAANAVVEAILASCHVTSAVPTPTTLAVAFICPPEQLHDGEQTVTIADAIEITLPPGKFLIQTTGDVAVICGDDIGDALSLHLSDCRQVNIPPPGVQGLEKLDAIRDSCRVLRPVTAIPESTSAVITPPSTGDAGFFR